MIPVIDLFAGPGGLAEGFSAVLDSNGKRVFDIKLSIEMDEFAHKTLQFRSFYRQFDKDKVPKEYYEVLQENDQKNREEKREKLYKAYRNEYEKAKDEAWRCKLGSEPEQIVDNRISRALNLSQDWVLIGGPPCQAFSLVGRSRVGGIAATDPRVYLYKEYLRIISKHQPSMFVMENVKGLLSAQLGNESIFGMILNDLKDPSSVFTGTKSKKYNIHSFVTTSRTGCIEDGPFYLYNEDFLIKMEDYGIPQTRHRVILLGIREDINIEKIYTLRKCERQITLKEVIGNLPSLRSGVSKRVISSSIYNGRVRHDYESIVDTYLAWKDIVKRNKEELKIIDEYIGHKLDRGKNFIQCKVEFDNKELDQWYVDSRLRGIINHETRSHLESDLKRYLFAANFLKCHKKFPRLKDYPIDILPNHRNVTSGKFEDRFRVQDPEKPATTITSHISKDGHYFIHYDYEQCRSLTVREAARVQTFPDNYYFWGNRTQQYHQVGNAVPPLLAFKLAEIVKKFMNMNKEIQIHSM